MHPGHYRYAIAVLRTASLPLADEDVRQHLSPTAGYGHSHGGRRRGYCALGGWGGSSVDKSRELTFTGRGFEPARPPEPDRSLPAEKTESCNLAQSSELGHAQAHTGDLLRASSAQDPRPASRDLA